MSTNYYAFGSFPGVGEPGSEGLHIGQSAAGWRFLFRAHADLGLATVTAWRAFLVRPEVTVRNDSGRDVTAEEMKTIMAKREDCAGRPLRPRFSAARTNLPDGYTVDLDGYHVFYHGDFC